MSDNRRYYDRLATPPSWELKTIQAGRLKGKSDINPQWRIDAMTEVFGPCGVGWKVEPVERWTVDLPDGQIMAFQEVRLYVREDGEWSEPIYGTGGNMLYEQERNGMHANDEAFKMATTDALGTAMKFLGVAADVYAGQMDGSKYSRESGPVASTAAPQSSSQRETKGVADMRVTWGKGDPDKGREPSKWHGMTFQEVWDSGPEGHSYLHWVAEKSTLNATSKTAARQFLDMAQDKPQDKAPAMATIDQIAECRLAVESAGADLTAYGKELRAVEEEYGGVPVAWVEAVKEKMAKRKLADVDFAQQGGFDDLEG
jgi:hypothetical protein